MQKETKYRIIGVLAFIALIVILFPFFQSGKEQPVDQALVNAPAFPESSAQVPPIPPASTEPQTKANDLVQKTNLITIDQGAIKTNVDTPLTTETAEKNKEADMTELAPAREKGDKETVVRLTQNSTPTKEAKVRHSSTSKVAKVKKSKNDIRKQFASSLRSKTDNVQIAKLKDGWVIQIGSFKNKTNAMRLVNRLRASGYKAFTKHVSTNVGTSTRVFVGPEAKRASAHALASKIKNDMHMQGIVINYKPLTL